nr:restriction endonuclease subunit S [Desmonostoc muscorum]
MKRSNRQKSNRAANDILISLVGTFGKVIVVPYNIERGIINPRLLRLSLDPNWVYPYFLQYWLISSATQKLLSETSHGGTMAIINAKVLSFLSVVLPTIPEQKAIAQILSDMDAEIEGLEQKRDKYKAIKQGMMLVFNQRIHFSFSY